MHQLRGRVGRSGQRAYAYLFHPVDQVLSLRGATGWHVESLVGALVALFTDADATLELNAYRIGTLRPTLVTLGRVGAVGAMAVLTKDTRERWVYVGVPARPIKEKSAAALAARPPSSHDPLAGDAVTAPDEAGEG